MTKTKIGVFDSGVGGMSVLNAVRKALPGVEVLYAEDKTNVPYGDKTPDELYELASPILQKLVDQGCGVIVIACNSVTTTIISKLRQQLSVPLIGMEPMVKPAAENTKSNVIAVCATPATLRSDRYNWLKATYTSHITVIEPDCSDWASMIEHSRMNHQKLRNQIVEVCEKGADMIVLGCTHYHWIEKELQKTADEYNAAVIQPEQAVIKQLKRVLRNPGTYIAATAFLN